jgi:hypothetical protein
VTRPYRPWTHKDLAFLRQAYGVLSRPEIAERLNRGVEAVGRKAVRLGIAQKHFKMDEKSLAELIRLTNLGYSEVDTARSLGTNFHTVRDYRRKLGLAAQPRSERYRKKVAERTRRQCQDEGVASLVELRWMTHRVRAAKEGRA